MDVSANLWAPGIRAIVVQAGSALSVARLALCLLLAMGHMSATFAYAIFGDEYQPGNFGYPKGWVNGEGYFKQGAGYLRTSDPARGYSTATSTYSMSGHVSEPSCDLCNESRSIFDGAQIEIAAKIEGNGTTTGNILDGKFIIRATAEGIPTSNISAFEVLAVADIFDASAIAASFADTSFLFKYTYLNPLLSYLGDYGAYVVPTGGTWGWTSDGTYQPWGRDVEFGRQVLTFGAIFEMQKVPEPVTLALVGIALAGLVLTRWRRVNAGARSLKLIHPLLRGSP